MRIEPFAKLSQSHVKAVRNAFFIEQLLGPNTPKRQRWLNNDSQNVTKDFKSSTVHRIRLRNIRAGTPAKVLRIGSRCSKYLPWISIDHSPKKQMPSHPSHPRSLIFCHLRRFSLQRLMCLGSKRHIDWTAQLTVGCDPPSHQVHQVLDHFNQKPTKVLEENLILRLNETLDETLDQSLVSGIGFGHGQKDLQPAEVFPLELPWHILMELLLFADLGKWSVAWVHKTRPSKKNGSTGMFIQAFRIALILQ